MVESEAVESVQFFWLFQTQIGQIHPIESEKHRDLSGEDWKLLRKGQRLKNKILRWDVSSGQKSTTMAAWQVSEPCFPQALPVFDYRGSNCRRKPYWIQIHTKIIEKFDFPWTKNANKTAELTFGPTHVSLVVLLLRKWDKQIENHWWRHWHIEGSTVLIEKLLCVALCVCMRQINFVCSFGV